MTPASPWMGSEDDGTDVGSEGALEGGQVGIRHPADAGEQGFERLAVGGLGGEGECAGAAAVEGSVHRDDPRPAGAPRQLDRRLERLGLPSW